MQKSHKVIIAIICNKNNSTRLIVSHKKMGSYWMGMSEEVCNKYEIYEKLMEMLIDRGYAVSKRDLNLTPAEFMEEYGDTYNIEYRTTKLGDKKDQILVMFTDILSNKTVKNTKFQMEKEGVHTVIFVVQDRVIPNALAECKNSVKVHFEIFKEAELGCNSGVHRAEMHRHRLLTEDEKTALLQKKDLEVTQLERIQVSGPVARYFGMRPGQVLKIVRHSEAADSKWSHLIYRDYRESACKSITYRIAA